MSPEYHPELWRFSRPCHDRLLQQPLGLGLIWRVEDGSDALRDGLSLVQTGDIGLCILLQVELAALPGHAGQSRKTTLRACVCTPHRIFFGR